MGDRGERMGDEGVLTVRILTQSGAPLDRDAIIAVAASFGFVPAADIDHGISLQGPAGPLVVRRCDTPEDQIAAAAEGCWWWPGAAEAVARHPAVIEIACPWQGAGRLEAHIKHTVVAAAVIATVPATGIAWGGGTDAVLVSPQQFSSMYAEMANDRRLPIPLWVRIALGRAERAGPEGAGPGGPAAMAMTSGLVRLGLMEIEVETAPMEPGRLFDYVRRLADYLATSGPVVGDGDAVGNDDHDRAVVRHAQSRRPGFGMVYRLEFGPAMA